MSSQSVSEDCINVNAILTKINDYTLRLDVQIGYSFLYCLLFLGGLFGNGLVIECILRRSCRPSAPNVFLLNLAGSNVLLCFTSLPITPILAFVKVWHFGGFMCSLVPVCQTTSVIISSYCLCFIAWDRYRSIVTITKEPWNPTNAMLLMLVSWFLGMLLSGPLFASQNLEQVEYGNRSLCGLFCGEYNWPSDYSKVIYGCLLLAVQFLIPVSIMCFCYWEILQKVRRDWMVNRGPMLTRKQQHLAVVRKRKVMYVLILMVVAFVFSWLPLTLLNLLRDFDLAVLFIERQLYFCLLTAHAIAMTSIIWNPVLYFWMSKQHRRSLKQTMSNLVKNDGRRQSDTILDKQVLRESTVFAYSPTDRRNTLIDPLMDHRQSIFLTQMSTSRAHCVASKNNELIKFNKRSINLVNTGL